MRRVQVVGPPGAGKSRLARRAADALGVPLVVVDDLVRLPGGRVATPEAYRAACAAALTAAPDGWVVDGDDVAQSGLRYADADVVVWLDVPVRTTLPRLVGRAVRPRAGWTRAAEAGVLRWSLEHRTADRARWSALAAADPDRWRRLDAPAADAWVDGLGRGA